ncbi:uncharacterized protein LOC104908680 [Beta vulgaris subsp. vulgaris]|uniref:uncharacterized protein LOC104908680 n=1 Tax=Beta vulgaris subsp. vulgaris TaxID=3555 RepID=UPI002036AE8F|nr:uncharacterized protein LOC104908680 [Beta vulgaris subsp. vulgaris]
MEQPQFPNSSTSSQSMQSSPPPSTTNNNKQKVKLPTPTELITHYESQGMNSHEASIKVIDDLQHMLFKVITSGRGKKDKFMGESSRKLDTANTRLAIIEMKLDSKPGYPQSLAIGVASAATFTAISAISPHLTAAISSLWTSVKGSTNT